MTAEPAAQNPAAHPPGTEPSGNEPSGAQAFVAPAAGAQASDAQASDAQASGGPKPRFQPGDRVKVDDRIPRGHCRAPYFIRGQIGTVALIQGVFHDPERLAYHQPGLPALPLYKIRFRQTDLWPDYTGDPGDQLEVDVYENWLLPAAVAAAS